VEREKKRKEKKRRKAETMDGRKVADVKNENSSLCRAMPCLRLPCPAQYVSFKRGRPLVAFT
jgi:hypothetical protein